MCIEFNLVFSAESRVSLFGRLLPRKLLLGPLAVLGPFGVTLQSRIRLETPAAEAGRTDLAGRLICRSSSAVSIHALCGFVLPDVSGAPQTYCENCVRCLIFEHSTMRV